MDSRRTECIPPVTPLKVFSYNALHAVCSMRDVVSKRPYPVSLQDNLFACWTTCLLVGQTRQSPGFPLAVIDLVALILLSPKLTIGVIAGSYEDLEHLV